MAKQPGKEAELWYGSSKIYGRRYFFAAVVQ